MKVPIVVLGAGGHAKVLIEALRASSAELLGIVDPDLALMGRKVMGVPVLGGDDKVMQYRPDDVQLVDGVGSVTLPQRRTDLFEKFKKRGFSFATVVHPSAVVASDVELGEGAQIMAGAIIQPGTRIGRNSIINTGASVDHDCQIGDHVHVAPGVTLSGAVTVGAGTHIGTGATVVQGVRIGSGGVVGAGALVLNDVPDKVTVMGVPAKAVKQ